MPAAGSWATRWSCRSSSWRPAAHRVDAARAAAGGRAPGRQGGPPTGRPGAAPDLRGRGPRPGGRGGRRRAGRPGGPARLAGPEAGRARRGAADGGPPGRDRAGAAAQRGGRARARRPTPSGCASRRWLGTPVGRVEADLAGPLPLPPLAGAPGARAGVEPERPGLQGPPPGRRRGGQRRAVGAPAQAGARGGPPRGARPDGQHRHRHRHPPALELEPGEDPAGRGCRGG